MLVTHIQFPASRPRLPDVGCRSSSAPTTAVRWPSTSPSHPRHLRIVLPAEERVPALAPRCLQGARPASRRSAGYNTVPLLDHSKAFISDFKQCAAIVDRMVANITLSVHRQINCRLFIVVSHPHLQNKKRKAPVTGPSSVDNALIVKHFA